MMCGTRAWLPLYVVGLLLIRDPHASGLVSRTTVIPHVRQGPSEAGCDSLQRYPETSRLLLRLRGGFDADDVLQRSLERSDHVAKWRDEFDGGPDFDDIPKFNVLNPDPNEPWPPIGSRGQRLGPGEIFDQQGYDNDDFEADAAEELAQTREMRAEKRNKEKVIDEFKYFDPKSIEGYDHKEDWIRDHLQGDDLALWRKFETFFKDIYPARDPETASARDIQFFLNATGEKKRKDGFSFLPLDQALALEKELDDLDKAFPDPLDLIQQSKIPRLVTWWHSGYGCYGYTFDVRARGSDLVVRNLHAASYTQKGPLHYRIWTTTGTWRYKCQSEKLWVLIGEGCLSLETAEGHYTQLPVNQSVAIKAGSTQAFYIHTQDDSFGVAFRSRPHKALEEGPEHAVGGCLVVEGKGVAVDGVLYSDEVAASGDVIERNEHLFVLTGAVSASERPFEEVFEAEEFVSGWCGMIDYTLGDDSATTTTTPA